MKTALVVAGTSPHGADLAADLGAVGIRVLGAVDSAQLVQTSARLDPDFIAWHEPTPDERLFDACALLASAAPRPVVGFTNDADAAKIERALAAGVHAYVVNGYALNRLRSLIHLAFVRHAQQRRWQGELADLSRRFDERKLVDRAKGILMRARQLSEDDAFRALRTASMASQRRVGQVSQQVIAAAHYAEAVNRAGKLRMLSQRLVRTCALRQLERRVIADGKGGDAATPAATPTAAPAAALNVDRDVDEIESHIAALAKRLSPPTFGDLLDAVAASWEALRRHIAPAGDAMADGMPADARAVLLATDAAAERLLDDADRLTRHLETAGLVTTLHLINVSGRQRMLSQRVAKQALLALLLPAEAAAVARADLVETAAAFEQAVDYLKTLPLATREIRDSLDDAEKRWAELQAACGSVQGAAGRRSLAEATDALVALFETLTDRYERSMQVLMG